MISLSTFRFIFWPTSLMISLGFLSGCASTPRAHLPAGGGHFSTVVIDPGHGGKDSGGVSGRSAPIFLREKDHS
jgi:N-acetylmuramoyl-L-alanine amidase